MSLASLPMYDWPECRADTDTDWSAIRAAAPVDLPVSLTRPTDMHRHWRDPALVFSQCCWGPLSRGLLEHLLPLAQPDYSVFDGGRGPFYRSVLVARDGIVTSVPETPAAHLPRDLLDGRRLAFNAEESLSGYLALAADLGADPQSLAAIGIETGSHRASIQAVARGQADIAAIDCRSWHLARRFEPCADRLTVIGWTAERLGLPYVTSRATDPRVAVALKETLLQRGRHPVPEGDRQ